MCQPPTKKAKKKQCLWLPKLFRANFCKMVKRFNNLFCHKRTAIPSRIFKTQQTHIAAGYRKTLVLTVKTNGVPQSAPTANQNFRKFSCLFTEDKIKYKLFKMRFLDPNSL